MGFWAGVLVISPQGCPLVKDPTKPKPHLWKLAGGKSEEGETPKETAVREVGEEIGIILKVDQLEKIYEGPDVTMGGISYMRHAYQVHLAELPELKERGNEGEEIGVFSPQVILSMEQEIVPVQFRIIAPILRFCAAAGRTNSAP